MEKISVVIPMYRSEKSIAPLVEELRGCLRLLSDYSYEILLVNDCGPDNVLTVAKHLASQDPHIKVIELMKNAGQADAMFAGYGLCTGEYIVSMDDDMQHPPQAIAGMLAMLKEDDLDVVFAKFPEPQRAWYRRLGTRFNRKMEEIMVGKPRNIEANSFFIMRANICRAVLQYPHNTPHIYGILFAITDRIANYTTTHRPRFSGKSNYRLRHLIHFWACNLFGFSTKPLDFAIGFGLIVTGIALLCCVILVIDVLLHPTVSVKGWASTVILIMFFSGVQYVITGFIGKYIARMYRTQSNLPNYMIRRITEYSEDGADRND